MQNVRSIDANQKTTVDFALGKILPERILTDEPKDATLISSVEAAKIIHRTAETVRRLCELEGDYQVFTTAHLVAGRWVIQRWEVEKYAAEHPEKYSKRKR